MFGKGKECEICNEKTGFFGSVSLKDGRICERCFEKAQAARGDLKGKEETVVSINRYIWDYENEKENLKEKIGAFASVFRTVSKGVTSLEEIMVGMPQARAFNGCVYVYGRVITGSFKEKKSAYIIHDGLKIPVNILAVSKCNEKDDMNVLFAKDQARDPVNAPYGAKLVLDIHNTDMVSPGDYIVLK